MANEFVIKNGFHSKGDSQVTGSLNVSGSITGSLFGSASYALTASYVNPTFISASAAASGFGAGGGSGAGFPYTGNAVITGSLLVSQSGIIVTGSIASTRDIVVNGMTIGLGSSSIASNVAFGSVALSNITTGTSNVAIGQLAGRFLTTATDNVAIGASTLLTNGALSVTQPTYNIAIGTSALRKSIAAGNTGIGYNALTSVTTGYSNTAIGTNALGNNITGYQNTGIGGNTLKSISAERNHVAIGINAMEFASSSIGDNNFSNVSIGVEAGRYMTGSRNVALGYQAMYQSSGSSGARLSVAIGYHALFGAGGGVTGDYNMAIGYRAMYGARNISQTQAFGYSALESATTGQGNIAIGNTAMQNTLQANNSVVVGRGALKQGKRIDQIVAIGELAAENQSNFDDSTQKVLSSVAIGFKALQGQSTTTNSGTGNTAIGDNSSQFSATATGNTTIGALSLAKNESGSYNVAIGYRSLFWPGLVSESVSIGSNTMHKSSGSSNVAIGAYALYASNNAGGGAIRLQNNNTAIGYGSGRYLGTGDGNVFIGYNAGPTSIGGEASNTISNRLYIANAAGNPLIGGDFSAKTVTISGSLYISGSIIPNADATLTSSFELGSPTAAWNRIWVRSSSIHFVDDLGNELAKISANPAGAIEMPSIYTSGTFTAQTFVTQSTTYIVEQYHATGSNIFGSSSLDTHQFTGSVYISGSLEQNTGNVSIRDTTVNGNLTVTESVLLTGLESSSQPYLVSIDTATGQLYYTASSAFIPINPDLSNFALVSGSNTFVGNQTITDIGGALAVQITDVTRKLYDAGGVASIDWSNRSLRDTADNPSIDYTTRQLRDQYSTPVLEYSDNQVKMQAAVLMTGLSQDIADSVITIDTATGQLYITSSTAFVANIGDVTTYLGPLNDFSASVLAFTSSIQTQVNNLTTATSSYVLNSVTSSMSVLSSSYALTASYALNVPTVDTSALVGTASFNSFTSSIQNQIDNLVVATSSYVVNSITSSMLAPYTLLSVTSSMTVLSASYAKTASYYNGSVTSASYAITASYISPNFISASVAAAGFSSGTDISALNTFTGSIQTQVDNLISATSSYITNSITSSMSVLSSSYATQADNTATIDINIFSAPVDSYLLMSNVAGTSGVAIGGDADLRYNTSTNVLTAPNISATTLTGSLLGDVVGTSSWAANSTTASYISPTFISASAAASGFGDGTDISSLNAFTGSIQTEVSNLTSATSSYVVNSVTSSMLAPYVLNSVTASMLTPYVLTSSTGSMRVLSSSYAATASYVVNALSSSVAASAGTASLVSTVGTNTGATYHVNFSTLASSYTGPIYTDAGGGLTFNPGTNILSTVNISATTITASLLGNVAGTSSWASNSVTSSYISPTFISASAASLGFGSTTNISALNTFTGSIQTQVNNLTSATSSYVTNSATSSMLAPYVLTASTSSMTVLSSSFASTASFVNTLNQTVIVTGSVNVSGSITARAVSASFTGSLTGHVTSSTIDTAQYKLKNSSGVTTVNWNAGTIGFPDLGLYSINWGTRVLYDSSNTATVNWESGILSDNSGEVSIDWINRSLIDASGVESINYTDRALLTSTGDTAIQHATTHKVLVQGPVTTKLNPTFLAETEDSASINYYAGEMYQAGDTYPAPKNAYGELLYLDYSTLQWKRIDQTSEVCSRYIGIDLAAKDGVLTEGHILMTDAASPFHSSMPTIENPLIGMPVYIIEGSNGSYNNSYTCNIPTSGYVRVIGHVMYQAVNSGFETKYMIKFKPSNDWYEI